MTRSIPATLSSIVFVLALLALPDLGFAEEASATTSERSDEPAPTSAPETEPEARSTDGESEVSAQPVAPEQSSPEVDSGVASAPLDVPVQVRRSAAEEVQNALDRLARVQALVIAASASSVNDEGEGIDRSEVRTAESNSELATREPVAARKALEQALIAIGKLEAGVDLRTLLEESGLVLTLDERERVESEEERLRGLAADRFEQVVGSITAITFNEGRLRQLKSELESERLTSAQAWSLAELFDFSRDRVEALVFLHPRVVDPENFGALLSSLKFESDRATVRSRLGLDG